MEKYNGSLIRQFDSESTGNAGASVNVTVRTLPSLGLATIYSVNDTSSNPLSNPLQTDSRGRYSFYAANGRYQLDFGTGEDSIEIFLQDGLDEQAVKDIFDKIESEALSRSKVSNPISLDSNQTAVSFAGFNASLSSYYISSIGGDVPSYRLFEGQHYTVEDEVTEEITLLNTYDSGTNIYATSLDPTGTGVIQYNSQDVLGIISGKMWAGESVSIACFGDSTTDGNQTTGWTRNPVSGGNAVGNSNQNLSAPNAWPAKLELLLRDMYKNNNIEVFNAGYSGKRMDDGWALANYDNAVTNNPFYGTPDITFVMFGLNDIQDAGSQLNNHITQTRLVIEKILSYGTTPVLLTCDPEYRNGQFGNAQDHKEVRRELDSAKKSIAKEYGIQCWDMGESLRGWIQDNTDGYNWVTEQTDALHFQDNGHAYKAQFIAASLFNDLVVFDGGEKVVNTWSSQSAYIGDYTNIYKFANNKQGGCVVYGSDAPTNTDMMTLWVWSQKPNGHLVYQGVHNEGCNTGSFTTSPSVIVKEWFGSTSTSKQVISTGGSASPAAYRRSDEQFIFGKLKYGLSKVTYKSGDAPAIFFGNFKVVESGKIANGNVLESCGRFAKSYVGTGTTKFVNEVPAAKELSNTAGVFNGETLSISFNINCPIGGGVILLRGQGYDGSTTALTFNRQNALMLYRSPTNQVELFKMYYNTTGSVTFSLLGSGTTSAWSSDNLVGRMEMKKVSGQQQVSIFDKWVGGSNILTITTDSESRWAGYVGGTFYNPTITSLPATVEIKEMVINRENV